LLERRGHLRLAAQQFAPAAEDLGAALKQKPSPQQRLWLLDALAQVQVNLGHKQPAFDNYQQLLAAAPDYFDSVRVNKELARLARELGRNEDAEKFDKEAQRFGAPAK
jgi:tetratricopeptide (TPR) repeat protein